jgi:hypothetical protein
MSQFFITFKEAQHLDLKHAVFGRTVGGLSTLDSIEQVGSDKKERPSTEVRTIYPLISLKFPLIFPLIFQLICPIPSTHLTLLTLSFHI